MNARRGFLGTLAGLFVAPWLKPTLPGNLFGLPINWQDTAEPSKTLYFLDTKFFRIEPNPMPKSLWRITDIHDPEMDVYEPIKESNNLMLLSEEASLKREMRITKIDHEKKVITYGFKEGL